MTGPAGSESRSGRGGCHPAASSRGPLGAHTIERPSPKFPIHRRFAGGGAGPGTQPACRRCRGTRAAWCSYHQATLTTPIDRRLAGGRSGPNWKEDPHRDFGCGVGPVTGSAGSDGQCGRGGRHRFRLKAEGLLMLIPSRGPHPFLPASPPPCRFRPGRGKSPRETQHTVHVPDTPLTLTRVGPARAARRGRRRRARRWRWPPGRAPPGVEADGGRARRHHGALRRRRGPRPAARPAGRRGRHDDGAVGDGPLVEVPVTYDGADLDDVADRWGTDPAGVAARLAGPSWSRRSAASRRGSPTSAACPAELAVPRLDTPRPRGAGRVGRGGRPLVRDLPDRVAGRLAAARAHDRRRCGTPRATAPALLAPGTRVRLVPA